MIYVVPCGMGGQSGQRATAQDEAWLSAAGVEER
jgi:hypothetical protein